jgi:PAS domain S-box-containing protein
MFDTDLKGGGDLAGLHSEIIDKLPVGVIVLQFRDLYDMKSALILETNSTAIKIIAKGGQPLRGNTLSELPELATPMFLDRCLEVARSGVSVDLGEIQQLNQGTNPRVYSARAFSLRGNCVGVTMEDLTARKAGEQAIRQSEEHFRLLVQGLSDYAILMLDRGGNVLSWNEGAERLKGYREEEILGKHFSAFYLPEDIQDGKPETKLREAATKGKSEDEGWRVRKDGSRFWANTLITALRDDQGNLLGFAKVTRDVTERREREQALRGANEVLELRVERRTAEILKVNELLRTEVTERERAQEQFRALAVRQEKVREDERTRVAREMHDQLGQLCTALKMDLAWIAQRLPAEQSRLREKADSALTLVSELIQALRRLSTELRPSTLDSLGLAAAMEWQAQEFQARTGIACQVFLPEEELVLDQEHATAIFRIFQETLTNVARHANATTVQANLVVGGKNVVLVVQDNGQGFDASYALNRGSPGLLGMKERAHLIGGDFKISSVPGSGTTVTVQVPFRQFGQHPI